MSGKPVRADVEAMIHGQRWYPVKYEFKCAQHGIVKQDRFRRKFENSGIVP